jgi:hypothetical protein
MKTYWPEIAVLEDKIASGDSKSLHKFIDLLAKHNLLNRQMLTNLCHMTNVKCWDLLHEFASNYEE